MKKFEYKENAEKEFMFKGHKYTTIECDSGKCCLLCDIGNKQCSMNRLEVPHCIGFNRADGKDVYFKKLKK